MQGVSKPDRNRRAESILEMVGLAGMGSRRIQQLSGGQRQRVALARSLVVDPDVLLLDEPLGALDLNLRRQMQNELKAIQQRVGTTFIHVTHDQDEAMSIADLIVVLKAGKIEDIGPPSRIYLKPATRFTATFMGDNNLFDGTIRERTAESVMVDSIFGALDIPNSAFPETPALNSEIQLCLRPEQIMIIENGGDKVDHSGKLNLGKATLREHTFVGTHHDCTFVHEESGTKIKVRLPQRAEVVAGQHYQLVALLTDVFGLMKLV
jgi:spermidine/putrescine transport system ATP-binding protein